MSRHIYPDWSTSALITIDTQNDFTLPGAPAEVSGTFEILPNMKLLLDLYRVSNLPIVHVVRLYKEDGSNAELCRREAIEQGAQIVAPASPGSELVAEIRPLERVRLDPDLLLRGELQQIGAKEWIMYKPRWGAFHGTQCEQFLRDRGVTSLLFSGCNYPHCPRTSIYEASSRDFRIVLAGDAVSGLYDQGVKELKNIGVEVIKTTDIMGCFPKLKFLV
ncbi:cysteine hydrolase [Paenibacillus oenotherae]|uniref:Cysteine hydrolase n=1 Tax=Paenibacillus oenotherae TaxID=1435645 RepID=A0ABS7DB89_9BACL|nr:isochorismatase family cysteine hydrolase [Paenibacillus oenotherae]MBW7477217.1 cysteine hydrolase [Paenibacillus oenotherae]